MGGGGTNKISESKEPSAPTEWSVRGRKNGARALQHSPGRGRVGQPLPPFGEGRRDRARQTQIMQTAREATAGPSETDSPVGENAQTISPPDHGEKGGRKEEERRKRERKEEEKERRKEERKEEEEEEERRERRRREKEKRKKKKGGRKKGKKRKKRRRGGKEEERRKKRRKAPPEGYCRFHGLMALGEGLNRGVRTHNGSDRVAKRTP